MVDGERRVTVAAGEVRGDLSIDGVAWYGMTRSVLLSVTQCLDFRFLLLLLLLLLRDDLKRFSHLSGSLDHFLLLLPRG